MQPKQLGQNVYTIRFQMQLRFECYLIAAWMRFQLNWKKVNYLEFKVNTSILFVCSSTNDSLCALSERGKQSSIRRQIKVDLFVFEFLGIAYPEASFFLSIFCMQCTRVDQWEIYEPVLSKWQQIQCAKKQNASSRIMIGNVNVCRRGEEERRGDKGRDVAHESEIN